MGDGCLVVSYGYNGSISIGHTPDKKVWLGWGEGPGDARDQMKQYCAQAKQKCELKHIFSGVSWPENIRELGVSEIDHSENYFPGLPEKG